MSYYYFGKLDFMYKLKVKAAPHIVRFDFRALRVANFAKLVKDLAQMYNSAGPV